MSTTCAAPLLLVAYVSSARVLLNQDQILELLRSSRRNNTAHDITGMLLYKDGNFMQVLEGPEPAIEETLHRIRKDGRHGGILELLRKAVEEREFADWSMGFKNLEQLSPEDRMAFTPFLADSLLDPRFQSEPGLAHKLLCRFKQNQR